MSLSDIQVEKGGKTFAAAINVVAEAEDAPVCWICLDGPQPDKPLMHPCRCPSFCHAACIARWQLQSAGTRREKYCDFCNFVLPDWKEILTPRSGATAPAVMNVNFDNRTYSFQVSPGADGYRQFTEAIRKAFHLPDDSELNITFTCDEPSSAGALLTLSGPGAYDAAVHCASVSAARRSSCSGDESSSPTASSPLPSPADALGPTPTLPAAEGGEGLAPVSSNAGSRTGAAEAGAGDGSQAAALHHSASFHSTTSSGPVELAPGAAPQHQPASHNLLQSSSSLSTSSSSLTLPAAAAQQQDQQQQQQQQQQGAAAGGSGLGCTSPAASSPPHSCSGLGWCAGSNASTGMCPPSDASAAGSSSSSSSSSSRRTSAQGGSSASPSASASDSEGSQHGSNAAAAAAAAAGGNGSGASRLQRRGSVGLGRKLRSALSDLLVMK